MLITQRDEYDALDGFKIIFDESAERQLMRTVEGEEKKKDEKSQIKL